MKFNTLDDLFIHELQDLYSAEKQITQALPKMAKAASSSELESAFMEHLEQTKGQITRLEKIFEICNVSGKGEKCKGIEGIIEEGEELIKNGKGSNPDVLDAGLIASAQRVEHYEMAGYGTFANLLGQSEVADLLEETLNEEKETDAKLTQLAESTVNIQAKEA